MSIHAFEKVQQTAGGVSIHASDSKSHVLRGHCVSGRARVVHFYSTVKLLAVVADGVPQPPPVDILPR